MGILIVLGKVKRAVIICDNYLGETDAILTVFEKPLGSGKLHAFYAELITNIHPLPLIEIIQHPPKIDTLMNDFSMLAQDSVSFDLIPALIKKKIDKTFKKVKMLNDKNLERMKAIFIECTTLFAGILNIYLKEEKAMNFLDNNGMSEFRKFLGKSIDAEEVQEAIGELLVKTFKSVENSINPKNYIS